jgi:hypothetical protein
VNFKQQMMDTAHPALDAEPDKLLAGLDALAIAACDGLRKEDM